MSHIPVPIDTVDASRPAATALDKNGRILGMRTELYGDVGANTVPFAPLANNYRVSTTVYDAPGVFVRLRAASPQLSEARNGTLLVIIWVRSLAKTLES